MFDIKNNNNNKSSLYKWIRDMVQIRYIPMHHKNNHKLDFVTRYYY